MICRVCGSGTEQIFSLGEMPLANSLLASPDESYPTFPLNLVKCESCTLVQLEETVPPEQLFVDYNYLTSCSPPMVEHAKRLVEEVISRKTLTEDSYIVEVGSNDGYLLQHYKSTGARVLGIDPSEKAAEIATQKGVWTLKGFFNHYMAQGLNQKADIIHANNVLAHVPDLNDFVAGLAHLLKDDGTLIVEVPYLCSLIDKTAFDTIYHEHVYYFSLTALSRLFRRHNLIISDAQEISTHGGSLRLWVTKSGVPSQNVLLLYNQEYYSVSGQASGYYRDFSLRVEKCKFDTRKLLHGKQAVGFGAAAKATIFLNACGLTSSDLAYVVDDTPTKQGKYIPGTGIPIVSSAEWLERQPPFTLILCWNFSHDIAHRYRHSYRGRLFTWYTPDFAEAHA